MVYPMCIETLTQCEVNVAELFHVIGHKWTLKAQIRLLSLCFVSFLGDTFVDMRVKG